MGLQLLGLVRVPVPPMLRRLRLQGGVGAFLTGLLVSLVLSPCGTPALAVILAFAAFKGSVVFGAVLLFAYGLGTGLPLLVVGTAAGAATLWLKLAGWKRVVDRAAGVAMVLLGVYLAFSTGGRG